MSETQTKRASARGGARAGAGRPPSLARQLSEAKQLQRRLRELTSIGIVRLAESYGTLMETVIKDALDGDKKARLFLLDLGTKLLRAGDIDDSPLDILRAKELHLHKHEHIERPDNEPHTSATSFPPLAA